MSAFLMGVVMTARVVACDFCLQLPRVPFEFDHPAAIEVALATQAAAAREQIDLNPDVTLETSADSQRTVLLSEISPRQLIAQWVRTRPAAGIRSLRCSLELVFVDVDYAGPIDIRFGEILPGNPNQGPADARLITTKAGFCRLLEDGLAACEERQLVVLEAVQPVDLEELQRLFSTRTEPFPPDQLMRQASVSPRAAGMAEHDDGSFELTAGDPIVFTGKRICHN